MVDLLSAHLFGRHVRGGAQRHAGLSPLRGCGLRFFLIRPVITPVLDQLGEAEVEDFDATILGYKIGFPA
jgi:hypothetical protein